MHQARIAACSRAGPCIGAEPAAHLARLRGVRNGPHQASHVRCSPFLPWRFHAKMKMADDATDQERHNEDDDMEDKVWIDNGSVSDKTSGGWK